MTTRLKVGRASSVYFKVSKTARVGITVLHGAKTLFLTSANFPYGRHAFGIPALPVAGNYTVRMDATDLAGNYNQIQANVRVSR